MISTLILQPLLTGLSVGTFCLTYCFPLMGSLLATEERTFTKNIGIVLQFLAGRLAGYLLLGFIVGYLGKKLDYTWLRWTTDISFIVLSALLTIHLLSHVRENRLSCLPVKFLKNKNPLIMGFLMGMNLCPPFLLSAAYIFQQQNAFYGIIYFTLFFLSSSIYFLPLVFIGLAARAKEFRTMAYLSGFGVALIFFVYGLYSIFHNIQGS